MLYVIKAALTLAVLYSCFFVLLSKENFHRFNRLVLVGIMVVSLVVPLLRLTTAHPTAINQEFQQIVTYAENAPLMALPPAHVGSTRHVTMANLLGLICLVGSFFMLLQTFMQTVSLLRFMRQGIRHTDSLGNTVVLHNRPDVAPFSIFRFIVMSVEDYETSRPCILTHEQEHIRLGHTYDLLLLQFMKIVQWFNPFVWFLARDLKAVHEYEADQAVINQGIDAKSYQQLLVRKAVGNRLQTFTNNLNHGSLKKRILMMYQKPTTKWAMLKVLCALPVVALTLNAFATPTRGNDPVEDMVTRLERTEVPMPSLPAPAPKPEKPSAKPMVREEGPMPLPAPETQDSLPSVDSLAEKLPGVEKHGDNSLSINGKHITKILVEGVESRVEGDAGEVFEICEEPAQYPGGKAALARFVSQNLRYPKEALEKGTEGQVTVQFIIQKDGRCTDFKATEMTFGTEVPIVEARAPKAEGQGAKVDGQGSSAEVLIKEAIRVCRLMPQWIPAKQRGKVVRMRQTIPFTFRLQ